MSQFFIEQGNLVYCTLTLHEKSVGVALPLIFMAVQSSLVLSFISESRNKKKKDVKVSTFRKERNKIITTMVCSLLAIVFMIISVAVIANYKKIPGVLSSVAVMLSAFLLAQNGLKWISFLPWKKNLSPTFSYAVKNIGQVRTLGNMSGLLAIFLIVVFAFTILLSVCIEGVKLNKNLIMGDYLILNASEETWDILDDTVGVRKVTSLYKEYANVGSTKMMLLSSDKRSTFISSLDMETLPRGNEAYFAKVLAEKQGFQLGQMIPISIGEKTIEVRYVKAMETTQVAIFIDADYWDIPMNYLVVTGEKSISKEKLYDKIVTALVGQSTTVLDKEEFVSEWVEMTQSYLLCLDILYIFVIAFSVVGMGDSLFSSYRSRREEFSYYQSAGMNRETLRKLKGCEILCVIGIAVVTFLLYAGIIFVALSEIAGSTNVYPLWLWREATGV